MSYTAAELDNLKAVFVDPYPDPAIGEAAWSTYKSSLLADKGIDAGQGAGKALIASGQQVDVTGHSLGGHLALLMDRLFPTDVRQIVTLNAPGVVDVAAEPMLKRFSPDWNKSRNTLIEAAGDGVSEIGTKFLGSRFLVGQEDAGALGAVSSNHSSVNGVDGLVLTELLGKLDAAIGADPRLAKGLIDAGSNEYAKSYEGVLDGLRRLLQGSAITPTAFNNGSTPSTRESLYNNLDLLAKSDAFKSLLGKASLSVSSRSLGDSARTDFASLVGLLTLSPVRLSASSGNQALLESKLQTAWSQAYAEWQVDKGLTSAQKDDGAPTYSDRWIADRAEFVGVLMTRSQIDAGSTEPLSVPNAQPAHYKDFASSVELDIGLPNNVVEKRQVQFGSTSNDLIVGKKLEDHLYGNAGNDTVQGQDGADWLEGNAGADSLDGGQGRDTLNGGADADTLLGADDADRLLGGAGNDSLQGGAGDDQLSGGAGADRYMIGRGEGVDRVLSSEAADSLMFAGRVLTGQGRLLGSLPDLLSWTDDSTADVITYAWNLQTRQLAIQGADSTVLIDAFEDGDLGLRAPAQTVPATPAPSAYSFDLGTPQGRQNYQALVVSGMPIPSVRLDNAVNVANVIAAGSTGDDIVIAGTGGASTATRALLFGNAGNDLIYAGMQTSLADAIAAGETQSATGKGFLILTGEEGNDQIVGAAGDDVMYGGEGSDTVVGGAGNDIILADGRNDTTNWLNADTTTAWSGGANDVQTGQTRWMSMRADLARIGTTGSDSTGQGQVVTSSVSLLLNPLANVDFSGLLAMTRSAIALEAPGYQPDSQRTYADLHGGRFYGTNVGAGNDVVYAGAGDDVVNAGKGNDSVFGGSGTDIVAGYEGDDFLEGGSGNDRLYGDFANAAGPGVQAVERYTVFGAQYSISNVLSGAVHGNDYLDGGLGDDVLMGGGGHDVLLGGDGSDHLLGDDLELAQGESGRDYLNGGNGDDYLVGDGESDDLQGGDGNDQLFGDDELGAVAGTLTEYGDDYLDGGAGNDKMWGGGSNDYLTGGDGNDWLAGEDQTSTTAATTLQGDDSLFGGSGADTLIGGNGQDVLDGGDDNDLLFGGSGSDSLYGGNGDDYLAAGDGLGDLLDGGSGKDYLLGGSGNDTMYGGGGNDTLISGGGIDLLEGGDGDDVLDGRSTGSIVLHGGAGNDTLYVSGYTTADGGDGDDTYYVSKDTSFAINFDQGNDRFVSDSCARTSFIIDESMENIAFRYDKLNSIMTMQNNTGKEVSFKDFFNSNYTSSAYNFDLYFADGLYMSLSNVADMAKSISSGSVASSGNDYILGSAGNDSLAGLDGSDTISGGAGNDTLDGGAGSDYLMGGDGDDVLTSSAALNQDSWDTLLGGAGNDSFVIEERSRVYLRQLYSGDNVGSDKLIFKGQLSANTVSITRQNGGFTVSGTTTNGTTTVSIDSFSLAYSPPTLTLSFADGTSLSAEQIRARLTSAPTDADDLLSGFNDTNDSLNGGKGNDTLNGYDGNDTLLGGDGVDQLTGGAGNDWLDGGVGNDYLYDDAGSDTFTFGRSYGADQGNGNSTTAGGGNDVDTLQLAAGITTNDISLRLVGYRQMALNIIGTTDTFSYQGQLLTVGGANANGIDRVNFADGSIWDREEIRRRLSIATAGADLLQGTDASDSIAGLEGNDTLYGEAGDDTLVGGAGNDYLTGAAGRDTYVIGRGEGQDTISTAVNGESVTKPAITDVLKFDQNIQLQDLVFRQIDNLHLLIRDAKGGGSVTIENYFTTGSNDSFIDIIMSDGTRLSRAYVDKAKMAGSPFDDSISGSNESDVIAAGDGNDYVDAYAGDDRIEGGAGADTLRGGGGNDSLQGDGGDDHLSGADGVDTFIFSKGGGHDFIEESSSYPEADTLQLDGVASADVRLNFSSSDGFTAKIVSTGDTIYAPTSRFNIRLGGGPVLALSDFSQYTNIRPLAGASFTLPQAIKGKSYSFSIPSDRFSDPDVGDSIHYSLDIPPDNYGNKIDWLKIDERSGALYGTPGIYSNPGRINFKIVARDNQNETAAIDVFLDLLNGVYGTSANDTLTGGSSSDAMYGYEGNDTLDGKDGADVMEGGSGNDLYYVNIASDIITENNGEGVDQVYALSNYQLPGFVEYLSLTGSGAINGTGNDLANNLVGNSAGNRLDGQGGNDTLDGGAGIDTLAGGPGDDTYVVDRVDDVVMEVSDSGIDTVRSVASWALGAHLEKLVLTGSSAVNGTGNELANTLTGNAAANRLDGLAGADTMIGGAGNDTYVVDNLADAVTETASEGTDSVEASVSYALSADVENLTLTGTSNLNATGNALANKLTGNAGSNRIDGGLGNDTMVGGAGNDTYVVTDSGDVVTEASNGGIDAIESSITWTLGAEVENLTLTGAAAINGTGNAAANTLRGNAGANRLDGGTGIDTLIGGAGDDVYRVDVAGDVTTENSSEGTDSVEAGLSWTLAANIEKLVLTGSIAINGSGNTLANTLLGNAAANRLDGGAGTDTMTGGAGDDTYVVDVAGDVTAESASGGIDTVEAALSWTLAAEVEKLLLTGTGNNNATGNTLANTLTGNAGANRLEGGAGADTMMGGTGNDTYVVDNASDVVTEAVNAGTDAVESSVSWTLGAELESLTLTGTAGLNSTGNALANTLRGNAGNNVLDGATGIDTLIGGAGDDLYRVDVVGDVTTENANEGTDTVEAALSWTLAANIEKLVLAGSAAVNATGNTLNNTLQGNAAANRLDGSAGVDTMTGGAGDDTYVVDTAGDTAVESASGGIDTVEAALTWTLGAEIEKLILTGTANNNAAGNALANTLTGNAGANRLDGLAGADTMIGGAGNDTYVVDNAADVATEAASGGTDTVESTITRTLAAELENLTLVGTAAVNATGNTLNNVLVGNVAANTLSALSGADTLDGGAGADVLNGAADADIYIFSKGYGVDTVQDNDSTANVKDVIKLGAGIAQADMTYKKVGNNLEALINGTSDKIVIQDWYLGSQYHVEEFSFSDGSVLTDAQIQAKAQSLVSAMSSFAPSSVLGDPAVSDSRVHTWRESNLAVNSML